MMLPKLGNLSLLIAIQLVGVTPDINLWELPEIITLNTHQIRGK